MAQEAFKDAMNKWFVVLGDDVAIETLPNGDDWMAIVRRCFKAIADERRVPLGFGCMALRDSAFLGFPTFPVFHRLHLEIFDGKPWPDIPLLYLPQCGSAGSRDGECIISYEDCPTGMHMLLHVLREALLPHFPSSRSAAQLGGSYRRRTPYQPRLW